MYRIFLFTADINMSKYKVNNHTACMVTFLVQIQACMVVSVVVCRSGCILTVLLLPQKRTGILRLILQ